MKFSPTSRMYFKIFLGFWTVTIVLLISSSVITHFLNLGPDKHLSTQQGAPYDGPGGRLLREVVSNAVNYDYRQVETGIKTMPSWALRHFYLINEGGDDILQRGIPAEVGNFLRHLNDKTPYFRKKIGERSFYGRQFYLRDGSRMRLVVTSERNVALGWRLFFSNLWPILLVNILLSGVAFYYLARYITRDIQTLKKATQQIAQGNWNVRLTDNLSHRSGELGELGEAFDNMVNQLQKSMLEQKRLIKDVSHELRSPLARLQVALAIAQQRANSEITGELERIKQAADYLNDVISDILSLPISEQGSWELNDVVDICSLLSTLVDINQEEADGKQVRLQLVDNLQEALVQTRGNSLVSVFDNILRNAIRYTEGQSVITVRLLRDSKGRAQVVVSDQGPGVDEAHLEDIFEPFFRTDEARDRKSGGYGLGLAIAKRTVLHHNGQIHAANNPHRGLAITVTLPEAAGV